jgi:hypothetical protein
VIGLVFPKHLTTLPSSNKPNSFDLGREPINLEWPAKSALVPITDTGPTWRHVRKVPRGGLMRRRKDCLKLLRRLAMSIRQTRSVPSQHLFLFEPIMATSTGRRRRQSNFGPASAVDILRPLCVFDWSTRQIGTEIHEEWEIYFPFEIRPQARRSAAHL